ncbi:glycosyltransferase family 4 protein [Rhizobium sp.]|uniref:glycosyltransferase family 4 protein n=1 Tax=Rhizobium sp. TaxID=391 RepID=UPI0028B1AE5E
MSHADRKTDAPHLVFAIPGDIEIRSGGYGYDRRVIEELRKLGWRVDHVRLPDGFPAPSRNELETAARQFADLADGSLVLVDGLAFGAMPEIARREAARLKLVALIHHPLALETGMSERQVENLRKSEATALTSTRGIVVTSPETARTLIADFSVPYEAICVAIPGTECAKPARGSIDGEAPLILAVGSLTQRKDHATLVAALARLRDRPWHCRIVGSDSMDPVSASALRRQITDHGLDDRIVVTGALDDVDAEYDRADIFALASRYEGFGMVFAEAMARGLPIVGCRGGAVPDLVPDSAGILLAPGEVIGFSNALATLLDDRETRRNYAAGSLVAGRKLPDWRASAKVLADFLKGIR